MYRDRGVQVVGISTMDSAARVEDFSRKYGLSYLQLLDAGQETFGKFVEVGVVPRTIVVDQELRIAWLELGYTEAKLDKMISVIDSLLEEGADSPSPENPSL